MEDCYHQWLDPLLATDASWQRESCSLSAEEAGVSSSMTLTMVDQDSNFQKSDDVRLENTSSEMMEEERSSDPVDSPIDGRSMLGISLTSPDLVIYSGSTSPDLVSFADSPDIPRSGYGDSPAFAQKNKISTELSLDNGIDGPCTRDSRKTLAVKFSTVCQTFGYDLSPESSFELPPPPPGHFHLRENSSPVLSINSGSESEDVTIEDVNFLKDDFFSGGETIRVDAVADNGENLSLYQTARTGNFSYEFQSLEPRDYLIDLHFAEIVFTEGPPGIRVFDIFVQGAKVISSLDVFAQVGANAPLVIADLRMLVGHEGKLSIRFEEVTGSPILCGISIRKDAPAINAEETEPLDVKGITDAVESQPPAEEIVGCMEEGESERLRSSYQCQNKEIAEMRKAMEELKKENQMKGKECEEAWNSLRELQNELMRKSMHVGSLAFAIEGQVKEKSRWFTSLRDLTRKLKIMKMEQVKLMEETSTYKIIANEMNEMGLQIRSRMKKQVELHEDLKVKFAEGAIERKELYNKILELKGNIRVFCRCRPLNSDEMAAGASLAIDFESAKDGELTVMSNGAPRKIFKFDSIFGPQASQADVFEDTVAFATSVLDGYNVCIFAYGQTGTGKTFTMEGSEDDRGVNYRTLEKLFQIIKERRDLYRYEISVSVLEVYNEQIRDLLVPGSQMALAAKRLEIRQASEGNHHVPGLAEAQVKNIDEVWDVLKTGSNARAVGATNANEHSSRSHCIHCVMVKGKNLLNGECTKSKLWLVDLAGSERVAKTEVQGERLKETQNINRSLSALGDVISALSNKSPHVPFRNSKLTHLLQDSLGGDSKTLMFVQISPNEKDLGETLCSLNFASRVRGIELGPARKQLDNTELLKCKQMVEKSKQEMKGKDMQMKKMGETIYALESKIKERDTKNKALQDRVKELESQLLLERKQQQQQMIQQNEDENSASTRPPLANRLLVNNRNAIETATLKEPVHNIARPPLSENNSYKHSPLPLPPLDSALKNNDHAEKENNPEMSDQFLRIPKRRGRASICTFGKRIPPSMAPRRNSLAPLPSIPSSSPSLPLPPRQPDRNSEEENGTEPTHCMSPKLTRSNGKMLSSVLRRSLHKRTQMKYSPRQQYLRKGGGINVGMEKVRVSIGSRGRLLAHRAMMNNARRAGLKEAQQKPTQKEKERGWI